MIRAGILSMQRIFNYGSFLQSYGLKSILEELGCSVEFVDYHPGECLVQSMEGVGLYRKIVKALEVLKYHTPLKEKIRFIKYKKNYAANNFHYLGITDKMNYSPKVELLVIGSDEVFNCVQDNTNVGFSPELFGEGSCAKRTISYAASFGNTTYEKLRQYNVADKVSGWLKKLDAISVRDSNSVEIVKRLTGNSPKCNLDPVLMYDFMNKCKEIPAASHNEKYIILYGYSGRFSKEECNAIRSYTDKKQYKVYCIGGVQNCCDKFLDCSPFEVLAYFRDAQAIITDTFHGTIMSVINQKPFITFVRSNGYGNSEKLTDLMKTLHLETRIARNMGDIEELIDTEWDYAKVSDIIEEERRATYQYLRKEIELCIQN
ncbi:MAG: polysaccharide pyruvyl transferase family protein [Suilimivivens sp.]